MRDSDAPPKARTNRRTRSAKICGPANSRRDSSKAARIEPARRNSRSSFPSTFNDVMTCIVASAARCSETPARTAMMAPAAGMLWVIGSSSHLEAMARVGAMNRPDRPASAHAAALATCAILDDSPLPRTSVFYLHATAECRSRLGRRCSFRYLNTRVRSKWLVVRAALSPRHRRRGSRACVPTFPQTDEFRLLDLYRYI